MADWNRAFRNDWVDPEKLSEEKQQIISICEIRPSEGLKTWKDVFVGGTFIGMVRVKLCGCSECKENRESETVYCGEATKLNSADSIYSLAVLRLIEINNACSSV